MRSKKSRIILSLGLFGMAAVFSGSLLAQARQTPSPAFFIAEFTIHDRDAMQPYRTQVESTFKPFGGAFVARSGAVQGMEGASVTGGVVIIQFPDHAHAQAWYESKAYRPLRDIRHQVATTRAYIVDSAPNP